MIGFLAAVVIWIGVAAEPKGCLHVTLLTKEGGHTVLIRSPQGQFILINGSPSGSELISNLEKRFSPFDRNLDALLLTEAQSKPPAGVEFPRQADGCRAGTLGGWRSQNSATWALGNALRSSGAASSLLKDGQVYQVEPGLEHRLSSSSEKATGLRLDLGNFTLLLPGETPPDALKPNIQPGGSQRDHPGRGRPGCRIG